MQWTEQAIKSCLDGTFTRLTHWGEFVTKEVPKGFIPNYDAPPKPRAVKHPGVGSGRYPRSLRKPWTPEEDQMLLQLRAAGVTKRSCCGILRRSIKYIRARLVELEAQAVAS
jgi:hypothetical protein